MMHKLLRETNFTLAQILVCFNISYQIALTKLLEHYAASRKLKITH